MKFTDNEIVWPAFVSFQTPHQLPSSPLCKQEFPVNYPSDFEKMFVDNIGKLTNFSHKNSGDFENQLEEVRAFLKDTYKNLGLETFSINASTYLGIEDYVVVAVIPGSDPTLLPLLLCDHYDTAYAEDTFSKTGERVSTPGADDNGSATSTLLLGAAMLRNKALRRTIWLVHLTGEEFPGDDVGARAVVTFLLSKAIDVYGIIVLDMLSWRKSDTDRIVQINSGKNVNSLALSSCFLKGIETPLVPTFRGRWDEKSYLFNTDAVVFDENGFDVLLINEHINIYENFDRPYYHQSSDTVQHLDPTYGAAVAKLVISGVASLSI